MSEKELAKRLLNLWVEKATSCPSDTVLPA